MSADISCQHICVSEGVFPSVSGCEEIQHGLSSYHTNCSTCPSIPQQTEGQNCRESVPAREQFWGALLSPSPAVPVCTPAVCSSHPAVAQAVALALPSCAQGMCQEGDSQRELHSKVFLLLPVPLQMWRAQHRAGAGERVLQAPPAPGHPWPNVSFQNKAKLLWGTRGAFPRKSQRVHEELHGDRGHSWHVDVPQVELQTAWGSGEVLHGSSLLLAFCLEAACLIPPIFFFLLSSFYFFRRKKKIRPVRTADLLLLLFCSFVFSVVYAVSQMSI